MAGGDPIIRQFRDGNGSLFNLANVERASDAAELAGGVLFNSLGQVVDSTNRLPVDTELPAAVAAADNLANPTAPQVLSHLMGYDGSTWDRITTAGGTGAMKVNIVEGGFGTEKGLASAPFFVNQVPDLASGFYRAVTGELTLATATGVQELLTFWHPSSNARAARILGIWAHMRVVQTAGTFAFEAQFMSAENGTPGGTTISAQANNRGSSATSCTLRSVVTGAPTTTGNLLLKRPFALPAAATPVVAQRGFTIFEAPSYSEVLTMRASTAEGIRLTGNVAATLTTAPIVVIEVLWYEP